MNTKTLSLIIITIGLVMTLYTGFNYVTRDKLVDIGGVHITADENHSAVWSPFVGIGIIVIGGFVYLSSKKKLS